MRTKLKKAVLTSVMASMAIGSVFAGNPAPLNPYLADSNNPIGHNNSAQQTSVPGEGPTSPSRVLDPYQDVTCLASGTFQFGQPTSGPYPDDRRVLWGSGIDRIVKIDYETHDVLSIYKLPGRDYLNMGMGLEVFEKMDTLDADQGLQWVFQNVAPLMADLSGAYTVINSDNQFVIGRSDPIDPSDKSKGFRSSINVYGDAVEGDPDSQITKYDTVYLPDEVRGSLVGMNVTFDGWYMMIAGDGKLVAVSKRLRRMEVFDIASMIDGVDQVTVCNSVTIDEDGGVYVATENYMVKVVWDGRKFRSGKRSGAWVAKYPNETTGSGSTPSLMGFGEEDQFVVITDGKEHMGIALFWRNEIPDGWMPPEGVDDPRYAGYLNTSMVPLEEGTQTEQSVLVNGYGAMVVNNTPSGRPAWFPEGRDSMIVGWVGHHDTYKPHGVEKFEWDPVAREFTSAWVNMDVSSLNAAPTMAAQSDMAYTVGARDGKYTVEAIDWATGETARTWVLGSSRFNSLYAGILIDMHGRLHYTSLWGKTRLEID